MGIYIKGMKMPKNCLECYCTEHDDEGGYCPFTKIECLSISRQKDCPLVEVPPHGRLIDADVLRKNMYHDAFEVDSDMQKWESGCWIRYKMFENNMKNTPTIIEAEEET